MTNVELKAAIDLAITSETASQSISPSDVGGKIKQVVDYVDQETTPNFLEFVGKITKSGSVFTLTEYVNTLGLTLVPINDASNCVITEETTANFLNATSTVEVWDTNYLNTVITKFNIASLNSIIIFTYYDGYQNINFTNDVFIRIKKYTV